MAFKGRFQLPRIWDYDSMKRLNGRTHERTRLSCAGTPIQAPLLAKQRSVTASNSPQQPGHSRTPPLDQPRCRAAQRPTPGRPPAPDPPLGGEGGEEVAREGRKRRCEGLAERALPGEWGRGPRPGGGVGVGRRRSRRPSRSGPGARRAALSCPAGPRIARRRVGERRLLGAGSGRGVTVRPSGCLDRGGGLRQPVLLRSGAAGVLGEVAEYESPKCRRWGGPAVTGSVGVWPSP